VGGTEQPTASRAFFRQPKHSTLENPAKLEKTSEAIRVQSIVGTIAEEFDRRFHSRANLIWFGSWMKGTARPHSDIDLAIEYHGILAEKDLNAFRSWLDDLPTLYRIDLVDMNSAGEKLKAEIKRYGKIL